MMKQVITLMIFVGWLMSAAGQNFEQQFIDLYHKKDTVGEAKILTQWKSKKPNDPELYVAYFNYYVQKSVRNVVNGKTIYSEGDVKKAFEYIDRGIVKFPNRLDMRFGKIYMLGEKENYAEFTNEIIKTIDYSAINKNAWIWTDGKAVEKAKQFLLTSVEEYFLQLYTTRNAKLLDNMKRITETVLKYYPDHVAALTDLSIVYVEKKNYDKALEQLFKAEKLAPDDFTIANKIAEVYRKKGDTANAIIYYQKVVNSGGDVLMQKEAQKKIDELKKK